jgi:RNA polymerase sigma factor (sigma-70 family)
MQQVAEIKPLPVGEATFADLLQPLIEPGFRLALAMLHDPTAAEDAVQEACFTAWRKLGRMADAGRLRPWFLGVVANKCRNARRNKWTQRMELTNEVSVGSSEDTALSGADLRSAIARLGYDDRLAIVLYFYLDMPVDEVATVAGKSVGATRTRLHRAIKKLRPDVAIEEAPR